MQRRLTGEEYLRWVERQPKRCERVGGVPGAMTPERAEHIRVKSRIWAALDRAIREAGLDCEAIAGGITTEGDGATDYEPDAVANCGPRMGPDEMVATNPVVVVDVLSPSTQSIDTSDKLADYFRVLLIRHYLILRARRREIIRHHRQGDEIVSRVVNIGTVRLDPPGIAIGAGEVYVAAG